VDEWQIIFDDFASKTDGISVFNPKDKSHVYLFQNYLIEMNMPIDEVDSAIKMLLGEQPEKPTNPKIAKQAKDMGLKWKGKGYGPENKKGITHKVDNDKLVTVDDKEDDKEDKEKEKPKAKANVVSKDAEADREKDHNTDVSTDYQRDGGEEQVDLDTNIPQKQVNYYKELSERESLPFDEENLSRAEQGRRARILYSKLQLMSMGVDVELNDIDKKNMEMLRISGNARSGQLYIGDALDKDSGLMSAGKKSPEFTDRNKHKNELLRNWDKVSAQLEKAGVKPPKFKVAAGILTDKPPVVDHDPLSVKPNRILDEAPTTKGTSLITGQTLSDIEKNQGVKLGDDEFFGRPLNPEDPLTFVDNISMVMDYTKSYVGKNADDDTKKYFNKFIEDMDSILNSDTTPQEKLERVRSILKEDFSDLVFSAMELNEDEGKNILKDYGELATYMMYLSEGKEAYLPKSGNYPLADIVVVSRDEKTGEALTIDGYSIKSQRGKEQQPGSSASEFLKHFGNSYPEHKETFEDLNRLHKLDFDEIDTEAIKNEDIKNDMAKIKDVTQMESVDDFESLAKELLGDKVAANLMVKVDRFHKQKAEQYGIEKTPQGMGEALKELLFREYAGQKTLSTMSDLNLDSRLKFIEVVVGDGDVDIRDKGKEYTTKDFGLHDKGYLPLNKNQVDSGPPPKISNIKYASANLALRTKKK